MHRILSASAFLLLSFLFFIPHSFAVIYLIDGDVSEWGIDLSQATNNGYLNTVAPTSPTAEYVREDSVQNSGYVEPGYGGQTFDIEAMYFDSDPHKGYLAIVTGFPISGALNFGPGDLGIDVSTETAAVYGDSGAATTIYEYGIKLSDSKLYKVESWQGVYYDSNPSPNYATFSDPWIINATTGSAMDANFAVSDNPVNSHYVYEFSFLLADLGIEYGDPVNFHWTMECGNDYLNLPATVNHTPEPASMLLLGTGLLGIASISRKKFKK
jgi:hypothetical protein